MGIEGMNFNEKKPEGGLPPEGIAELERASQKLELIQARSLMQSFQEHHPEVSVDVEHPENNPPEIRNAAAMEWVQDGSAERFRDYIDGGHLTPAQQEDLSSLLANMRMQGKIH